MNFYVAMALLSTLASADQTLTFVGATRHPEIREASGFVKSRKHADVFWIVNDSGNPSNLYAIRKTGELLASYSVTGAVNLDWEALAIDDNGNLYIGDVGNNVPPGGIARRWVYQVREPDPLQPGETKRSVAVEKTYYYSFPKKPFDVEGMFFHHDTLWLVSKVKKGTTLYRLPLTNAGQAVPLAEGAAAPGASVVTGASISEDGRRLALCSYDHLAVFTLPKDYRLEDLRRLPPLLVRYPAADIEGCCWDGDAVLLITEPGQIYRFNPQR